MRKERFEQKAARKGYYSLSAAAKIIGISTKSLRGRVARGTVRTVNLPGSRWLWVTAEELNRAKPKQDYSSK